MHYRYLNERIIMIMIAAYCFGLLPVTSKYVLNKSKNISKQWGKVINWRGSPGDQQPQGCLRHWLPFKPPSRWWCPNTNASSFLYPSRMLVFLRCCIPTWPPPSVQTNIAYWPNWKNLSTYPPSQWLEWPIFHSLTTPSGRPPNIRNGLVFFHDKKSKPRLRTTEKK